MWLMYPWGSTVSVAGRHRQVHISRHSRFHKDSHLTHLLRTRLSTSYSTYLMPVAVDLKNLVDPARRGRPYKDSPTLDNCAHFRRSSPLPRQRRHGPWHGSRGRAGCWERHGRGRLEVTG